MEPGAVEGEKPYNAQIKEKTPAASAPRSSDVAKKKTPGAPPAAKVVHSSYMDPLVKEIRTSIRTIENMMDSTAGGKFADPSTKKAVQDLLSEWNAFKGLKADKATIDSLAEELVKKVDEAQVVERKAKTKLVLSRQKQVTDDLKTIDDKAVADAEAKAAGGVDPKKAADAKAEVVEERTATKGDAKKFPPQRKGFGPSGSQMRAGLVDQYTKANPNAAKKAKSLAKKAGFDFDNMSNKARLHYLAEAEGDDKMLKWVKGQKKGATTTAAPKPDAPKADAPKPPATTTAAPTKKGKRPNSNKTLDATYKYVSEKTGKSVSALKKAAAKAKGGQKPYLFSLLNSGQQAELNDPNYGKTPTAQTPSAKKAAKSRAGAKPPATTTAPVAATVVDEKPPTQARQAAASKKAPTASPRPSPNQIDEKPVTQAKPKPKDPAAQERGRKGAAATQAKNQEREAKRQARKAAARKGAKTTRLRTEAYIAEGLTPEQARTKAGREGVELMREVKGKKGIFEGSKTPHKGKVTGAVKDLAFGSVDPGAAGSANVKELGKAATQAQKVASKIPPSVLKGLGKVMRVAGPAGAVASAAAQGYNISQKGLVEAMRDTEFNIGGWGGSGKSRSEMDVIQAGKGEKGEKAPTQGLTRDRMSAVKMALRKAEKEGKSAVGMMVGKQGDVAKVTAAEVRAAKEDTVRTRATKSATTIKRPTYTREDALRREGKAPSFAKKAAQGMKATIKKAEDKVAQKKAAEKKARAKARANAKAIAKDKAKNLPFLKRVLKRRGEAGKEKAASDYKRRVARESLRGTAPTKAEKKAEARSTTEAALKRMRQRRGDLEQEKVERVLSAERSALYPKAAVMQSFKDAAEKARKEQAAKRIDAETKKKIKGMGLELSEEEKRSNRLKRFGY